MTLTINNEYEFKEWKSDNKKWKVKIINDRTINVTEFIKGHNMSKLSVLTITKNGVLYWNTKERAFPKYITDKIKEFAENSKLAKA